MKNVKNIFAKIFMVSVMLMVVVMPTFADNGCEDDNNDAISAEFALCSTHVYNIGDTENPDSTQRDLMNDVVAMKSELITQQMYRHYEQMESMLRRFKTQLEKAVLTSNLQAAGASKNSDDSGSSFKQTNMNIFMAGIKDCNSIMDGLERVNCFNENYTTIYNATGGGMSTAKTEAKRQLAKDFGMVCMMNKGTECEAGCGDSKLTGLKTKTAFQKCLNDHRSNLNTAYENARTQEASYNNPWMNKK